jgi:hypothetical protein
LVYHKLPVYLLFYFYFQVLLFLLDACPGEDPADLERQTIRGAIIFVIVLAALIGSIFWGNLKQK